MPRAREFTRPSFGAWVTCPRPSPQASLRLFCFAYAGGGASIFRNWPDFLTSEIEICPIQLPGRESRLGEAMFTRLLPLIQTLVPILRPYLNKPFIFFGHSLGALISFELARQLRRENEPEPIHMFVSGCRAPQLRHPHPSIHQLPLLEFVDELRRLNGTPEEVLQNIELIQLLIPLLRADFAIYETYVYTPDEPLDCSISAFGGLQDRRVSYNDLAAWRDQTHQTFTLDMFPGEHFFIHSTRVPLLHAILQNLRGLLNRVTREIV